MAGGTDVHNSVTAIEADNFFGKQVIQEPGRHRRDHFSKQGFGFTRYSQDRKAAGFPMDLKRYFSITRGNLVGRIKERSDGSADGRDFGGSASLDPPYSGRGAPGF
ncbi:MAG: hypothetical protein U9Q81_10605 [Pseudomonadota bacterium]|nr:hypothetical protein [Pseudomonadota bacterium]